MPDLTLSPAIREARAINPTNIVEIETLEVHHPQLSLQTETLQVALLMDLSVANSLDWGDIIKRSTAAATNYARIRWSFITFDTSLGINFPNVDFVTAEAAELVADNILHAPVSGNSNGYAAIVKACEDLRWVEDERTARAMILITDKPSINTVKTQADAIAALQAKHIMFATNSAYHGIIGSEINAVDTDVFFPPLSTEESYLTEIDEFFDSIFQVSRVDKIYLVNDNVAHRLPDENGIYRDFLTRGFALRLGGEGKNGVQNLSITIDDVDRKVSRYLNAAKAYADPVELTFRVYLSTDLSGPANNPPLTLYVSSSQRTASDLRVQATTIDLVNAPFPNAYYLLDNFPLT